MNSDDKLQWFKNVLALSLLIFCQSCSHVQSPKSSLIATDETGAATFCPLSFSSYTENQFPVAHISFDEPRGEAFVTVIVSKKIADELRRKNVSGVASINGVCGKLIFTLNDIPKNEHLWLRFRMPRSQFDLSSLRFIKIGQLVSLALPSTNKSHWLVDNHSSGLVSLVRAEHDEKTDVDHFTFECDAAQFEKIKDKSYLGLDGSGFIIQERMIVDGRYFFVVHAWKETQKKTHFSVKKIEVGFQSTLNLAF